MSDNISPKIYPTSSEEVAKRLGFDPEGSENNSPEHDVASESVLPIEHTDPKHPDAPISKHSGLASEIEEKQSKLKTLFRSVFPYLMVFLVGLVAYYFFFADTALNLSGIFKNQVQEKSAPLTIKDTALMELEKDTALMEKYNAWISQFYFEVSDASVIAPNADNSGNGLS